MTLHIFKDALAALNCYIEETSKGRKVEVSKQFNKIALYIN